MNYSKTFRHHWDEWRPKGWKHFRSRTLLLLWSQTKKFTVYYNCTSLNHPISILWVWYKANKPREKDIGLLWPWSLTNWFGSRSLFFIQVTACSPYTQKHSVGEVWAKFGKGEIIYTNTVWTRITGKLIGLTWP